MSGNDLNFIIITLAKNEEVFLPQIIPAVINGKILPKVWVIVNDNSIDKTLDIAKEYSGKYEYIKYITITDTKTDLMHGRYSLLCNTGFNIAIQYCKDKNIDWKYIGNLDADTLVPENYFFDLMSAMNEDKAIGIASGKLYEKLGNSYILDSTLEDFPRGTGRLIRKECFDAINGYQGSSPDSISNIKSKLLGWKTKKLDNIFAIHLRKLHTKEHDLFESYKHQGRYYYLTNVHPLLFMFRFMQKLITKEFYYSFYLLNGYIVAHLQKLPQTDDKIVKYYYYYLRLREILHIRGNIVGYMKTVSRSS